ncbi:N-acetylmuramoyl-L-alanine amidase [Parvularcula sp. IMCC14364]|uniref:N-acetylmuramoyl-L-alanine amidase family protein n=1 Tax=Parvularcula sp. IMCC14364 TaxID=3067902 RepID=UPI002741F2F8|nr:N-acetylmuramoyl-L-alanine amidase [Parvularcula sp. IMCC14364]
MISVQFNIRLRHFFSAFLLGAFVCLSGQALASDSPRVENVRFGVSDEGETRIVLDVSGEVKYRVFARNLDGNRKAVSVEIEKSGFNLGNNGSDAGTGNGIGHVGTYAYRAGEDGRSRLIFDLVRTAVPTSVFLIKPKGENSYHRLVIDVAAGTEEDFSRALGQVYGPLAPADDPAAASPEVLAETDTDGNIETAIALAEKAAVAESRQQKLLARAPIPRVKPVFERHLVVIDAGHGGRDPGAVGPTGVYEKTVNLAAARQLRELLKARGYSVILTREGDTYPELEERIEKARVEDADLFISIHADAAPSPDIRGASVYTLSDKGSVRLANQVRSEGNFVLYNEEIHESDPDVSAMLLDIASRDSRNSSTRFANLLINELQGTVQMVNNTHREASYVVLLAPDVPAVLLELGFISNAEDELNLNSRAWRQKTVTAVADAIDSYFLANRPIRQAMRAGGAR